MFGQFEIITWSICQSVMKPDPVGAQQDHPYVTSDQSRWSTALMTWPIKAGRGLAWSKRAQPLSPTDVVNIREDERSRQNCHWQISTHLFLNKFTQTLIYALPPSCVLTHKTSYKNTPTQIYISCQTAHSPDQLMNLCACVTSTRCVGILQGIHRPLNIS